MRQIKQLFLLCLLALGACSDYSLSVNDKVLYTPPGIFTDFRVDDLELQRCLDQSIAEASITAANQLERLQCPAKGIRSVEGVAVFAELSVLGLEDNQVKKIEALVGLEKLQQLNLANNNIENISALHSLKQLHYVDLRGNNALDCAQLAGIRLAKGGQLLAPAHCK